METVETLHWNGIPFITVRGSRLTEEMVRLLRDEIESLAGKGQTDMAVFFPDNMGITPATYGQMIQSCGITQVLGDGGRVAMSFRQSDYNLLKNFRGGCAFFVELKYALRQLSYVSRSQLLEVT